MYTNEFPTPNLHEVLQDIADGQHELPGYVTHTSINRGQDTTELTVLIMPHITVRLTATGESTLLAYTVVDEKDPLNTQGHGCFDLDNFDNHAAARQITGVFLRGMVSPQRKDGEKVTEIHAADMAAQIKDIWGDENTEVHDFSSDHVAVDFHEDGDGARLIISTGHDGVTPWYSYRITPINQTSGAETPYIYRAGSITTQGEYDGVVGTDNQDGEIDMILDELSRPADFTVEEMLNGAYVHGHYLVSVKQGH